MKTLILILNCCSTMQQSITDVVSGVCWGVILLLALYFLLCHVFSPLIANRNERKIKELIFEQEEVRIELKKCKEDKAKLEKEKNELNQALLDSGKEKNTLRQEILKEMEYDKKIADLEKKMLEEQIKTIQVIIKNIGK